MRSHYSHLVFYKSDSVTLHLARFDKPCKVLTIKLLPGLLLSPCYTFVVSLAGTGQPRLDHHTRVYALEKQPTLYCLRQSPSASDSHYCTYSVIAGFMAVFYQSAHTVVLVGLQHYSQNERSAFFRYGTQSGHGDCGSGHHYWIDESQETSH